MLIGFHVGAIRRFAEAKIFVKEHDMSNRRIIASLISENPNEIPSRRKVILEFFWKDVAKLFTDPIDKQLASLIDKNDIRTYSTRMKLPFEQAAAKAVEDLRMEYDAFARYQKSMDPEMTMAAFSHYKKFGRMPSNLAKDPRELDARGGEFRPGGRD